MNVLIYDLSDEVRRTIENNVRELGTSLNIVSVNNASFAKYKLLTNSFDLVIIDVDNFNSQCIDIIFHARACSPQASIILLTFNDTDILDGKFMKHGVDYYFNGYFRFDEFIKTIQIVAQQFLYDSYGYTENSRENSNKTYGYENE